MNLSVQNLILMRGERTIIAGLSFQVRSGEALLLAGRNGTGKTTLIRALAGFLAPEAGAITVEGGDAEREVGEQCHYVGHLTGIKAGLSARENLAFWAEYLGGDGLAPDDALAAFGMDRLADVPAGLMSAGQKRRLGLGRLLVAQRPIWLLDEPTVSLDATSVVMLARVIQAHLSQGGIAVAATHLPLGLVGAKTLTLGNPGGVAATEGEVVA